MNAETDEGRVAELQSLLGLQPHPEGGHFAEVFRSRSTVQPGDARPPRQALTSIDFLLAQGQFSAWHRVASDEAWHLLEGGPLRLWLATPALDAFTHVDLGPACAAMRPRHVVPAGLWQAAVPIDRYAYVGATVGPGFEFADFTFGRDDASLVEALALRAPALSCLL